MRKLLLTGGTGFVGRNILPILKHNYDVTTCGKSEGNDVRCDLSKGVPAFPCGYDVIVHAAGKAHVEPLNEKEAQEFFDVNVQGTKNLCIGLEQTKLPSSFIFISTVSVYGCENGEEIDETYPLHGISPYAKSKIAAEMFLHDWCSKRQITLTILRPSLIAGPKPPGNLGIMIDAVRTGRYLSIAGDKVKKSVLMVYDIAEIIPAVEGKGGIYNICSDDQPLLRDLEIVICKQLGGDLPLYIPIWLAHILAYMGEMLGKNTPFNIRKFKKLSQSVTFSNEKAKSELGWKPLSVLKNFKIS